MFYINDNKRTRKVFENGYVKAAWSVLWVFFSIFFGGGGGGGMTVSHTFQYKIIIFVS